MSADHTRPVIAPPAATASAPAAPSSKSNSATAAVAASTPARKAATADTPASSNAHTPPASTTATTGPAQALAGLSAAKRIATGLAQVLAGAPKSAATATAAATSVRKSAVKDVKSASATDVDASSIGVSDSPSAAEVAKMLFAEAYGFLLENQSVDEFRSRLPQGPQRRVSQALTKALTLLQELQTSKQITVDSLRKVFSMLPVSDRGHCTSACNAILLHAARINAAQLAVDVLNSEFRHSVKYATQVLLLAMSEFATASAKGDRLAAAAAKDIWFYMQASCTSLHRLDVLAALLLLHANAGAVAEANNAATSLLEEAERENMLEMSTDPAAPGVVHLGVSNYIAAMCVRALVRAGDIEQAAEAYERLCGVGQRVPPTSILEVALPLMALGKQLPEQKGRVHMYRAARFLIHAALHSQTRHLTTTVKASIVSALFAAGLAVDGRVAFTHMSQMSPSSRLELAAAAVPYLSVRESLDAVRALSLPQLKTPTFTPIPTHVFSEPSYVLDMRDVMYPLVSTVLFLFFEKLSAASG